MGGENPPQIRNRGTDSTSPRTPTHTKLRRRGRAGRKRSRGTAVSVSETGKNSQSWRVHTLAAYKTPAKERRKLVTLPADSVQRAITPQNREGISVISMKQYQR